MYQERERPSHSDGWADCMSGQGTKMVRWIRRGRAGDGSATAAVTPHNVLAALTRHHGRRGLRYVLSPRMLRTPTIPAGLAHQSLCSKLSAIIVFSCYFMCHCRSS